jgi:hypothetical protein
MYEFISEAAELMDRQERLILAKRVRDEKQMASYATKIQKSKIEEARKQGAK